MDVALWPSGYVTQCFPLDYRWGLVNFRVLFLPHSNGDQPCYARGAASAVDPDGHRRSIRWANADRWSPSHHGHSG